MNRKEGNQSFYQATFDIYVGNVNKNIEEVDLKQLFAKYGEVKQVLCRRKDDYIGYAIVKFVYKLDAERVLRSTDEVICNGHHLPVKAARRSDQSQTNGPIDNKSHSYPECNTNVVHSGPNYSNTDFGYFHPPIYSEDHPMYSQPLMLEVLCTNVEDGITFYGYPYNRAEELAFLGNSLNQLNLQQNRFDRKPIAKKVYAALFSEDNSWYRCTVIQSTLPNKPGICLVRYLDYGNQEEVHYRNIIDIPESLQKVPPFTSRFILSNLVCDVKQPNKKTYLHQLVNKRMSLCAFLSNSNREYQVIKCSCNGKDVISETINKGFAKLKRSLETRPDTQQDFIPKPKAYACGSEIRLNNFNPPVHVLKAPETPNSIPNNNKISRKVPLKNKPSLPKKEDENCNGTVHEDPKKEQDFHPMRIIKRGSELSDVLKCNGSITPPKEKVLRLQTPLSMIDTVIPNLKLINNIRSLVSQSSDDSIVNCAVDLLKEEISTIELTENSKKCVGDAYNEYSEALNKIKKCLDKSLFPSLKLERDLCRSTLCDKLKAYLGSCDSSIFERKEKIQKTIIDLESNSNAWMNVQLENRPNNLEELVTEYNKVKEERWKLVSETRKNTNQKHKQFMDVFAKLQKELYLNTLEETDGLESHSSDTSTSKPPSYSEKLNEALKDLGKALDKEIQMLTLNKERKVISVIQCLLDILDVHKEKVDSVCELYENRYAMYNELSKLPDIEATLNELATTEEEVHNSAQQLANHRSSINDHIKCNVSKMDFSQSIQHILNCTLQLNMSKEVEVGSLSPEITDMGKELHRAMIREDYLKAVLAKASDSYFPELNAEHPELRLFDHSRNNFLLKNWKLEYFFNFKVNARRNSSFASKLLEEPIVVKEYSFASLEDANIFIKKAVTWNETKSGSLVKIKALFPGNETNVYVILPPVPSTLLERSLLPSPYEAEKACRMLRNVLSGLRDIHMQSLVHRCLHPLTVLVENDKALLDFCFDSKYLNGLANLKGISFNPPENRAMHESADMYSFGCLVLWALFPNLSFTATADGVPNVAAFRSIIEELILPKDYALLSSLVDAKPERRPSSSALLGKGFLSKYEAYCRSQCEAQKA